MTCDWALCMYTAMLYDLRLRLAAGRCRVIHISIYIYIYIYIHETHPGVRYWRRTHCTCTRNSDTPGRGRGSRRGRGRHTHEQKGRGLTPGHASAVPPLRYLFPLTSAVSLPRCSVHPCGIPARVLGVYEALSLTPCRHGSL